MGAFWQQILAPGCWVLLPTGTMDSFTRANLRRCAHYFKAWSGDDNVNAPEQVYVLVKFVCDHMQDCNNLQHKLYTTKHLSTGSHIHTLHWITFVFCSHVYFNWWKFQSTKSTRCLLEFKFRCWVHFIWIHYTYNLWFVMWFGKPFTWYKIDILSYWYHLKIQILFRTFYLDLLWYWYQKLPMFIFYEN